jgi:hypothetical protein
MSEAVPLPTSYIFMALFLIYYGCDFASFEIVNFYNCFFLIFVFSSAV